MQISEFRHNACDEAKTTLSSNPDIINNFNVANDAKEEFKDRHSYEITVNDNALNIGNFVGQNKYLIGNQIIRNDSNESCCLKIDCPTISEIRKNKPAKIKARKILIIEDNKFISDTIKSIIESIFREFNLDFEVIQGSDGVDMLKAVIEDQKEGNLIECVFTDENMEYMNGSEAIRILRDWEKSNKIKNRKLFSVSAQEDIESSRAIFACGADNVFGKPISKSTLIDCFRNVEIIIS